MASESHHNDIPVWFDGTQRWMTGLTKRTTCDDVIYAILVSVGLHEAESTENFAIFEKWREVERPLSARTKILKVWSFWGQEQPNVQLSMRSLEDYFIPGESSLYLRSRRRHKRSNRNRDRHSTHCKCQDRRGYTECSKFRTMEQLVKLVVSQERKIQDLNDRINDTDRLIDKHESRIHLHRVEQNGLDYVQNSYLRSLNNESSSSSADGSTFSSLDLQDIKAIFKETCFQELEEIAQVCDSLTHVEHRVVQEQAKIRELTREIEKLTEKSGIISELEEEANAELDEARVQMIRAVTTYVTNEYNERELDRKIDVCMGELTARTEKMNEINREISEYDKRHGGPVSQDVLNTRFTHHEAGSNSKNQETSSLGIIPLQCHRVIPSEEHNYPVSESNPFSNPETILTYEHQHYPNHKQCSDNDTLMDAFKAANVENSSTNSNTLTADKTCAYRQNSDIRSKFSDHISGVPFSRDGCFNRRSKDAQQPKFNRSRSAERSWEHRTRSPGASTFEASSNSGRIREGNCQPKFETSPGPREYTARGVVDQYGLELGVDSRGQNLRNSFGRCRSLLPSNPRCQVVTTSEIQDHLDGHYDVLESTDHGLTYQQQKQQGQELRYHEVNYNHKDNLLSQKNHNCDGESNQRRSGARLFSDNRHRNDGEFSQPKSGAHLGRASNQPTSDHSNRNDREFSQPRNSGQKLSYGRMPDSRISVNNQERGPQTDNLYTSGDRVVGFSCLGDAALKDRSLFEQNISGATRAELYNRNDVQRTATNNKGRSPTTPNKPFDQVQEREINSPNKLTENDTGGKDMFMKASISSTTDSESYEKKRENAGTEAKNSIPSFSNSGNSPQGEQTIKVCPPTQTGSQILTEYSEQDRFRPSAQDNKQYGLNPWLQFQHMNCQSSKGSEILGRQQVTSVMSDIYSVGAGHESGMSTPSNNSIKETCSGNSVSCEQKVSVGRTYTTYHPSPISTDQLHKEPPLNTDRPVGCSEKVRNLKDKTRKVSCSSSPVTPAKTLATNPKVAFPLPNIKIVPPSNCANSSMDTSRGALYHIVSNKMNKSKNEFNLNHHGTGKPSALDSSLHQQTGHDHSNLGIANSTEFHSSMFYDVVNSQSYKCNNKEQHSPFTYGYSNNKMHDSTNSSSYTNGDTSNEEHCNSSTDSFNKTQLSLSKNNGYNNSNLLSEKHGGLQTSLNTFVYDAATESHSTMYNQTKNSNISRNKPLSSDTILQNCINQINSAHYRGYSTQRVDTVSIQDISKNSTTAKDYYSSSRGNFGSANNVTAGSFGVGNSTKIDDANDSNSDTGLSSMHSDETPSIETLV